MSDRLSINPLARMKARPNHEPSFWLRGRLTDVHTRHAAGVLPSCGHRGARGIALWAMVPRCAGCAMEDVLTADADRTCDRCSTVCDRIHPAMVTIGQLVVSFGLCRGCHHREVGVV